jgi:hypothetical protein
VPARDVGSLLAPALYLVLVQWQADSYRPVRRYRHLAGLNHPDIGFCLYRGLCTGCVVSWVGVLLVGPYGGAALTSAAV